MHQANPEEIQARGIALLRGAAGTLPSLGLLWSAAPFPLLSRFQSPWFCTSVSGSFSGERGSPFHSKCLSLGHLCLSLASLPPNVASFWASSSSGSHRRLWKKGTSLWQPQHCGYFSWPWPPSRGGKMPYRHRASGLSPGPFPKAMWVSPCSDAFSYTGLSLLLQLPASWSLLCLRITHPTPGIKPSTGDQKMTKTQSPQTHILVGKTVEKVLANYVTSSMKWGGLNRLTPRDPWSSSILMR